MSRRFGRNQRRRMRTEIEQKSQDLARANDALAAAERLSADLKENVRELNQFIGFVGEQVGRHAIVSGLPSTLSMHYRQRNYRMPVQNPVPSIGDIMKAPPMSCEAIQYEIMHLLDVDAVRKPLSREMHFLAEVKGEVVGYVISESALRSMPSVEIERLIAPQMVHMLTKAIKEAA